MSASQEPVGASARPGLDVDAIQVTENGAASPDVDPAECRAFVLDEGMVRAALEEGESIGRDDYLHRLPWSPCLVRGRLVLTDGRQGTWTVRQYGTGSVLFDDGAEWFFWCRTCTSSPFVAVE
ncbi:hypothetical protein LY625_09790 [Lysobacter sp. GX 14042]|uniref:hypothetical protein n=1 Tax=Lysobacter sp. GX 14042 TaxID=2907155 RepID=UPI001F406C10|nr:hypothetical protein [Lysobacter sp. GX 14042]MCE7032899.1 hypothetical protein [Lysobacter sp. GX 14042]